MGTKTSQLIQLEINQLREFRSIIETALEKSPAGIDQMPFVQTIADVDIMIGGLADKKAAAFEAEEVERLKKRKPVTIRRVSYDPLDKVQVFLTPTSYSDTTWEVEFNGTLLGTISNWSGERNGWSANQGARRVTYSSQVTRVDAIRALLPRR